MFGSLADEAKRFLEKIYYNWGELCNNKTRLKLYEYMPEKINKLAKTLQEIINKIELRYPANFMLDQILRNINIRKLLIDPFYDKPVNFSTNRNSESDEVKIIGDCQIDNYILEKIQNRKEKEIKTLADDDFVNGKYTSNSEIIKNLIDVKEPYLSTLINIEIKNKDTVLSLLDEKNLLKMFADVWSENWKKTKPFSKTMLEVTNERVGFCCL